MTQQSGTDDRGDDAADDVATQEIRKCRQDRPDGRRVDSGCAVGMDQVPTQWPSPRPKDATPMKMRIDLARLASEFPAFSFMICAGWDGPRFEAWRDTNLSGLYAIITDDPDELLRELNLAVR